MTRNLLSPFLKHVATQPDRLAIVHHNGSVTYAELAEKSLALAAQLQRKGVKQKDHILLACPVDTNLFITLAALWRIGATIIFPEPTLGIKGLKHAIEVANPDVFLSSGAYRLLPIISRAIRSIPKRIKISKATSANYNFDEAVVTETDIALISFTSGSTGSPKAIARTHGFLLAQSDCLKPLLGQAVEDDIDLVAFPMFVVANLSLGLTSVLPNWKSLDLVSPVQLKAFIQTHRITRVLVPPVICQALTDIADAPSLRAIFTGGGPVFPDMLTRLSIKYPEANIVSVYGSTEAEPIAHHSFTDLSVSQLRRMRSGHGLYAGHTVPEISIRIEDDEILVTGEHVNKTYINAVGDEENKCMQDGQVWHKTGDAGRLDPDGLWLLGRMNGKAGEHYPFQVEMIARTWPGVIHAALIDHKGAVVVLSGQEPELNAWQNLANKLGGIRVVIFDKIPMDKRHKSKVDYVALRKALG